MLPLCGLGAARARGAHQTRRSLQTATPASALCLGHLPARELWTATRVNASWVPPLPLWGSSRARVKVWAQGRDCGLEGRAQGMLLTHNMPGAVLGRGEAPVPLSPVTGG